ncbi:unnamed protein product [Bemisia tabaci]|uniref:Sulfatase N-terminal domain-containing protein n=1 Tax=Bemisia tabaci TaxID=7038 RepID=A0A9P0F0Y8_BEMTA|nr:unnamed protein product [Bemisia tabaci]
MKIKWLIQSFILSLIWQGTFVRPGWNDVGFRGSNQIPTPNIDALAYNGIVLDRHYTLPTCTPSRAALLTGKNPVRMGLLMPTLAGHADGIPLTEQLLPQKLQKLGYVTRLIGKWHVGSAKKSMTPIRRGFHSHFGFYNGFVGYKNGIHDFQNTSGFDCYRNFHRSKHEVEGKYLTDVYTKEAVDVIEAHSRSSAPLFLMLSHLAPHAGAIGVLEARDEEKNAKKYSYIADPLRRLYAGVMEALDASVGAVVSALDSHNMLRNSVIIFISDNGGPTTRRDVGLQTGASNWPLRGLKGSLFEGGVRGVAVAWSPLFKNLAQTSDNYIHLTDWLPSLYYAAGGDVNSLSALDGINQWSHLVDVKSKSSRNQLLVHIYEKRSKWAVIKDKWKLVQANDTETLKYTTFYHGESGRNGEKYSLNLVTGSPVSKILRRNVPEKELEIEYAERRRSLNRGMIAACSERIAASKLVPPDQCSEAPCLFNIHQDPCEFRDVAAHHPSIVDELRKLYEKYASSFAEPQDHGLDPAALPQNWDGWWTPWLDS